MVQNNWGPGTQTWPRQQHIRWASDIYGIYPFWIWIHFTYLYFYIHAPPHFSFSPLAHFLSLLPVRGNRTTADLISPAFLPSHTCQVTKTSIWVTLASTTTQRQLVMSSLRFHSTDEFLPLCWGETWTSSGLCSESHTGSEHGGLEKLHRSTDGNVVADGDYVFQQSQFSGL